MSDITILHNYMDNIGGAEKVSLTLARELKGKLYSTNVNQQIIRKMGFQEKVTSIGTIPQNAPFRQQLALLRCRLFKNRVKGPLIISGDWAIAATTKNHPTIWYAHSPIREIWDLYQETRKKIVPWYARPLFDIWVLFNRCLNKKYVKKATIILCNSHNVKKRIKKYLNRDATVVYPPVDTKNYGYKKNGEFWLSVNRLTNHKRIELQLEAFKKLPQEKLIIVGSYEESKHFLTYKKFLEKIRPKNVTIIHHADEKKLRTLYANCKGFITTAKNEDFGLTPIEAMASGKPVVAPAEGGYLETIIDGKTGKLIKNITSRKIISAIKELSKNPEKYREACVKQAKKFDTKMFIKKITEEITKVTKKINDQ